MKTKVRVWGNSLAVRIPKAMAAEAGMAADSSVDLHVEDEVLVIKPASNHRAKLAKLVAQIKPDDVHRETDWGPPRGDEAW